MKTNTFMSKTLMFLVVLLFAGIISACDKKGSSDSSSSGRSGLTITGLPSGGEWEVYVFAAGTNIPKTLNADNSKSREAYGFLKSGNVALYSYLYDKTWTGSGSWPVLLLNLNGSPVADPANPRYSYAIVNFSNGSATVPFSSFTQIVQ